MRLRSAESIGRPLGDAAFLAQVETLTRHPLKPGKRSPKPTPPAALEPASLPTRTTRD